MHATSRRRWLAVVTVAVIVGLVSGTVIALVAGARRTASAPDRYTAYVGGDLGGLVQQESGPPRTDEIAALPGVDAVRGITFLFAGLLVDGRPAEGTIAFAGTRLLSARLIAGREPDPTHPHEFIASRGFVDAHGAQLGDTFTALSWTQAQSDHGEGFGDDPQGPSFEAKLVGIMDSADSLEDNYTVVVFPPALLDDDIGTAASVITVRLDPGVTRKDLRAALDKLPDGSALSLESGRVISAEIRNGVEAQSRGIWLMALVGAIAAVVALGQLLSRHARLTEGERAPLVALGFSRTQLAAETLARAALPACVGVVLGVAGALLVSGRFPTGFVRALEPDPGVHVDAGALAIGGILLLGCLLAWVAVAFFTSRPRRALRARSRHSETIARARAEPRRGHGNELCAHGKRRIEHGGVGHDPRARVHRRRTRRRDRVLGQPRRPRHRSGAVRRELRLRGGRQLGPEHRRPAHRARRRPRRRRADAHQRDPGPRGCDDDPTDGRRTRPRRARATRARGPAAHEPGRGGARARQRA